MEKLLSQLLATSPWEAGAALLGLAYLLLAVRRNLLCWLCAFVSTTIYLVLFARAALYMQSLLQVFYLVMAVYGFIDWRKGRTADGEVVIRSWTATQHVLVAVAVVAASVVNGWLLAHNTDAAAPYGGDDSEIVCSYCSTLYRHNPSLKAHAARPKECVLPLTAA